MNFDVIIPASKEDIRSTMDGLDRINTYLNPQKICLISSLSAKQEFDKKGNLPSNVIFIDEDSMVEGLTFGVIKEYLQQYGAEGRSGWYFQQFLKMGYSLICDNDFYLSWDGDTFPLKKIDFFDDEKVIFHMKEEYNAPYFDTIKKLLGLDKAVPMSFISEHMMFSTTIMRELISCISSKYDVEWYLGILDAVDRNELGNSGFSEFETYGTYVVNYYPYQYCFEDVNAIRSGKKYFGVCPSDNVLNWLGEQYSTISFEKWDCQRIYTHIYNNEFFRKLVCPAVFIRSCDCISKVKGGIMYIITVSSA